MRYDVDANGETGSAGDEQSPDALKARIRRLEDALAAIQDTQLMEERVVSRLLERFGGPAAPPAPAADSPHALPPADEAPADPDAPPPRPLLTLPPAAAAFFNASVNTAPRSWLLVDLWRELRLMVGMFTDYRFQVSWLARLTPVWLVAGLVLSWFFLSGLPLIGFVAERVADVVVAVLCYKILAREAVRYRKEVAQKPFYRA
jgi:hypothetical protein